MSATEHAAHAFDRMLNLVPSKDTERDWRLSDAVASGELRAVGAPPQSHNLRAAWWTIGDQEYTGSCVGWATGDGVLRYHLVAAELIGPTERVCVTPIHLDGIERRTNSPNAQRHSSKARHTLKTSVDICHRYGAVTEDVLPFHISTKMYIGGESELWAKAAQRRKRYYSLARLRRRRILQ